MKKIFIPIILLFLVCIFGIYFGSPYIDFYNIEFLHPLLWTLVPVTILLFLSIFLRNVKTREIFSTIIVFGIIDFIILSQVAPLCSPIFCFDRSTASIVISSIFSVVYFIVLLFKNRKKIA